jgi:hypothetical protein
MYVLVADADPLHNRIQAHDQRQPSPVLVSSRESQEDHRRERRRGLADKLAAVIADRRNPLLITHPLGSILRTRILAMRSSLTHY